MSDFNNTLRTLLTCIGLAVSLYILYVEKKHISDASYKPYCDINEKTSCTKVFSSPYATGLGLIEPYFGKESILNVPNIYMLIPTYALLLFLCFKSTCAKAAKISTIVCIISCVISAYLAHKLYVMGNVCVVCVTLHIVNFSLLFLNYQRFKLLSAAKEKCN